MEGIAYSTAKSYNLSKVNRHFADWCQLEKYEKDALGGTLHNRPDQVVFFFNYGVIVFWNVNLGDRDAILRRLEECADNTLSERQEEIFTFEYREKKPSVVQESNVFLASHDIEEKLAVSYAVAQSVKLSVLEQAVEKLIAEIHYIPEELALRGKISLSRKDIAKQIGRLYLQKGLMNLNSTLLDTPDFFWEHTQYKPLYMYMCQELDLDERMDLINHRYDMLHEIYALLSGEMQHQHSVFLEWVIIILISTEIVLALAKDVFHFI